MTKRSIRLSLFVLAISLIVSGGPMLLAQAPAPKAMSKDEVFFSIARRINSVSESPVSAIVTELDGLIEVTSIAAEADGKALVTVREKAPSNAVSTNKSTRMRFAPPPTGKDWAWVEFEENRKFYPVEKLFPYAKDELNRRKQLTANKWAGFVTSIGKQGEAATKAMETAKAVIKADPPPLAALVTLRATLSEAVKENSKDGIIGAFQELSQQADPITALADTYSDLKTNDAYLRLIDEYKNTINLTAAARKEYVQSVAAYNEILLRLPYTLVAYGLGFTRIEANIDEQ